jgi:hypothetical protein
LPPESSRGRASARPTPIVAFLIIVAASVLVAGGFLLWAVAGQDDDSGASRAGAAPGRIDAPGHRGPEVVFQNAVRDADYAHVAVAPVAGADRRRTVTPLVCERVHYAARRGLCLNGEQGLIGPKFRVGIFDERFRTGKELTVPGILSRARVSPDGRYGAVTGFVTGHSYADAGEFSTHTVLIDLASGTKIADLEDFTATKDRRPIREADMNYWGVTFAERGGRFYATLRTRGRAYLVAGDLATRQVRVLRENVECPSLSPDGTRIAYKKRVDDGAVIWRLRVLELSTMKETPLSEDRMVDDQPEWLDDDEILYGLSGSTWAVRADGGGAPRKVLGGALSPAVIR